MIRLADYSMITDLRQIRRVCFGEDKAYLDFYFSRLFCPEHTLAYLDNNRAVASLTMLPCEFVTPQQSIPACYIYAVATLPAFRQRGISTQLSQRAEELLQSQNTGISVLVPASESLFTFYEQQGFNTFFYRRKVVQPIAAWSIISPNERSSELNGEQLSVLRKQYLASSGCYIQWDMKFLQYAIDECKFNGGKVLFIANESIYAFCYPEGKNLIIKESNLQTSRHLSILNGHFRKEFPNAESVTFYCAPHHSLFTHEDEWQAFGMWKPLRHTVINTIRDDRPYIGLALD